MVFKNRYRVIELEYASARQAITRAARFVVEHPAPRPLCKAHADKLEAAAKECETKGTKDAAANAANAANTAYDDAYLIWKPISASAPIARAMAAATVTSLSRTEEAMTDRPLPAIEGAVIMRNTYYSPDHLRASADWARGKLAFGNCSAWERGYLQSQIERIELALRAGRAA